MAWGKATKIDKITNVILTIRYFKICSNIHIDSAVQPSLDETNKFWKIAPLVSSIKNACLQLPGEEHCLINKKMIPFTGRDPAK